MKLTVNAVLGGGIALALAVGFCVSDARLFEDAPISPLYQSTLDSAFNRFREAEARVPAGQGTAPQSTPLAEAAENPTIDVAALQEQLARGRASAPRYHDHQGPRFVKGSELAATGRYDEALAEFREALKEHPNCTLANHRIGDVLKSMGRFEEAIAAYGEVLKAEPNYICVYEHLGDIFASQDQPETAEKMFQQVVAGYTRQIGSGGAQAAAGARFSLARFYLEHNREIPQALTLAEAAAAEAPDEVSTLDLLTRCYQLSGRIPDAVATVDRIIALKPDNAEHYQKFREGLLAPAQAPAQEAPPVPR